MISCEYDHLKLLCLEIGHIIVTSNIIKGGEGREKGDEKGKRSDGGSYEKKGYKDTSLTTTMNHCKLLLVSDCCFTQSAPSIIRVSLFTSFMFLYCIKGFKKKGKGSYKIHTLCSGVHVDMEGVFESHERPQVYDD